MTWTVPCESYTFCHLFILTKRNPGALACIGTIPLGTLRAVSQFIRLGVVVPNKNIVHKSRPLDVVRKTDYFLIALAAPQPATGPGGKTAFRKTVSQFRTANHKGETLAARNYHLLLSAFLNCFGRLEVPPRVIILLFNCTPAI